MTPILDHGFGGVLEGVLLIIAVKWYVCMWGMGHFDVQNGGQNGAKSVIFAILGVQNHENVKNAKMQNRDFQFLDKNRSKK